MVTCITKMITSITVTGMGSMAETGITETGIMGSKVGRGAMLGNIVTIDSWGSYWGSYGSWGSVGSNMGHRLGNMVGNSLSFVQRLVVGGPGLKIKTKIVFMLLANLKIQLASEDMNFTLLSDLLL
jgi:hypothetical protein